MLYPVQGADYLELDCMIDQAYAPPLREAVRILGGSVTLVIGQALILLERYESMRSDRARLSVRDRRGGDTLQRIAFDPTGTFTRVRVNVSPEGAVALRRQLRAAPDPRDAATIEAAIGLLYVAAQAQNKGGILLGQLPSGVERPLVIPAYERPRACGLRFHQPSPVLRGEIHHLGEYPWEKWQHLCLANIRYCLRGCGWRSRSTRRCQRVITRLPDQK